MAKDATTRSIADVLRDVTKRHGLAIGTASEVVQPVTALTTGNLAIDYLTGVGGLPCGRITELYGQPSSGKTTTALQAAAELQKRIIENGAEEYIAYLDFEHALDRDYCGALGLDVNHPSFVIVQPNWLEEGADIGEQLISTGKVRLSIWDSVAKMTPRELEFGVRTQAMERARLLKALLERQVALLYQTGCAGVYLNHMTEAVSMGPTRPGMPPTETSPGGKALKFYASIRLAYKQIKNIKGQALDALSGEATAQDIATIVKVRVSKNKVGNPFRVAEVRVRYGAGFDNLWSALQVLKAHKRIVEAPGGMFYFDKAKVPQLVHDDMDTSGTGRPYLRGEPALLRFGQDHPQWRDAVIATATEVIAEHGSGATVDSEDEPDDDFLGAVL